MTNRREFIQWMAATGFTPALDLGHALPASQRLTDIMPPSADSDIGNLFPFIHDHAGHSPSLSFLQPQFKDPAAWRKRAKTRFMDLLHYSPPKCAPLAEGISREDHDGYVQEYVRFHTTPDLRVPAYVLIPKGLTKPAPGIVALHDHGGFYLWGKEKLVESDTEHPTLTDFKRNYYAGRSTASELARQGYVVIVIDMFYWGERRMLLKDDAADWRDRPRTMPNERVSAFNQRAGRYEDLVGRSIYAAGFTWPGVMLWDDMRTVDYLASRPEVDPKRIGCVGLSVGGFRACHLSALDERIKAGVVVGWMCSFPHQIRAHIKYTIGYTMLIPGLYRELDYPDVASLAIPRPLLVINGKKDGLFDPEGVQLAFDKLHGAYVKAGVPDRIRTRLYDTPHEFNAEMQAEAWDWLRKWV